MDIGERTRRTLGHVLHPIADAVYRIDRYVHKGRETALYEPFLTYLSRSMYATLSRFGIQPPWQVRFFDTLREARSSSQGSKENL